MSVTNTAETLIVIIEWNKRMITSDELIFHRQQARSSLSADLISEIAADPTRATKHGDLTVEQVAAALDAYCQGIKNIYYLLVSCCGVSFLVTVLMVNNTSLGRKEDVAPERDETSARSTQNVTQIEK